MSFATSYDVSIEIVLLFRDETCNLVQLDCGEFRWVLTSALIHFVEATSTKWLA